MDLTTVLAVVQAKKRYDEHSQKLLALGQRRAEEMAKLNAQQNVIDEIDRQMETVRGQLQEATDCLKAL